MQKKICIVSTIILTICLTLAGCGKKNVDTSVEDIRARGEFRVAIPNYNTSLLYYDNEENAYRGVEAEVIDIIAGSLGVPVKYVSVSRGELLNQVVTGNADMAIGYIDENSSSIATLAKTISYGNENLYVVTPRGCYAGGLSVFKGSPVGVSAMIDDNAYGDVYYSEVSEVLTYNDTNAVVDAFRSNLIKGYICYKSEALYLTSTGEFQVQSCSDLLPESFVMVALPEHPALIAGSDSLIKAYLEGEYKASWVTETVSENEVNNMEPVINDITPIM